MKIFISWSEARSKALAEILHEWLPNVIQAVQPWMSASDIDKGVRWSSDIALQLEETRFGIICLTPENLNAPWILFEAGALSKTLNKTYVCPYLFGVEPADLKGPLVQFQATKAEKEDTRKLIHTINEALDEAAMSSHKLDKSFEVWWPDLEDRLKNISARTEKKSAKRTDREILEEILDLVRTQTRIDIASIEAAPDEQVLLDPKEFHVGLRVRHARYGTGVILQVQEPEKENEETKIVISFHGYGRKKFVARFVRLERA